MPESIQPIQPTEPTDILAEVEAAPVPAAEKPAEIEKIVVEPKKARPKFSFRILILPLVILILVGLVYASYSLFKNFFQKSVEQNTAGAPVPVVQEKVDVPPAQITPVADADGDGLSDSEEFGLGSNPNKPDTDGDGLFDKEEIRIYKTDLLKEDTDGDGLFDGEEVKRGQDPKDPTPGAKLLKLEEEINNFK